jgi:cytochrome c-type biogenesis protein CcmH/NrfG
MGQWFTIRLTACTLLCSALLAQQPKTAPSGGVNPSTIPTPASGAALTGKFVLEDGTPPPDRVRVELTCNSVPRPQGWSDDKGHFSVQLGVTNPDEVFDLSYANPTERSPGGAASITAPTSVDAIPRDLTGCDLRGALLGYTSSIVSLSGHRRLDSPDVGAIVLRRRANVEGQTVSATTALAPEPARKSFEKGMEALKKRNPDDAQKELKKAVDAYPAYAAAWFQLGRVHESRGRWKEAGDAYRHSIAADAKYLYPYERLYLVASHQELWPEVREVTDKVIHLDAYDFPRAYYFNALANLNLNDMEAGEKSAREAVRLDLAANPRAGYVLGVILARKQSFAEAAELLRAYLKAVPNSVEVETVKQQLAALDKMAPPK